MPTGLAPIVGQQATFNLTSQSDAALVSTMMAQALAHTFDSSVRKQKCDLIANGVIGGEERAWRFADTGANTGSFVDMNGDASSFNRLRWSTFIPGNSITFTCAAPGTGERLAFDRDEDGIYNIADADTSGRKPTSVQAPDPDAEPVQVERAEGAFWREESQKESGIFPHFDNFWAFDFFN